MNRSVAVVIPTFNREKIVGETVRRLLVHARAGVTVLQFFVGISGDDDTEKRLDIFPSVRTFDHRGMSLGENLNSLLREAFRETPLVLQMDDDHWLCEDLDLAPHVDALEHDDTLGLIRLMSVGAHRFVADLDGLYWRIRWDSPEVYIPSLRPHLKHERFHSFYGLYPEGQKLGVTEEGFCHQCRGIALSHGGPSVVVPLDVKTESAWQHVGQSWQLKGY